MGYERYNTSANVYFNGFAFFKIAFGKSFEDKGVYTPINKYDTKKNKMSREAVIYFDSSVTYSEVKDRVNALIEAELPMKMPGEVYEFKREKILPLAPRGDYTYALRRDNGPVMALRFHCTPKVISNNTLKNKAHGTSPTIQIKIYVNTLIPRTHYPNSSALEEWVYFHHKGTYGEQGAQMFVPKEVLEGDFENPTRHVRQLVMGKIKTDTRLVATGPRLGYEIRYKGQEII